MFDYFENVLLLPVHLRSFCGQGSDVLLCTDETYYLKDRAPRSLRFVKTYA